MTGQNDPSIPLSDGECPILNICPESAMIRILSYLDDFRSKMQLSLICKGFENVLKKRSCWIYDDKLTLGANEHGRFIISAVEFSTTRATTALDNLLSVCTIRTIEFEKITNYQDQSLLLSICGVISRYSSASFSLEHIIFTDNSHNSFNNERSIQTLITSLVVCPLDEVKILEVFGVAYRDIFFRSFWPLVLFCPKLVHLYVHLDKLYDFKFDALYHCLDTLNCCPNLTTLEIENVKKDVIVDSDQMAHLINSLNLTHLAIIAHLDTPPAEFVTKIGEECRSKIVHFTLFSDPSTVDEHELWDIFIKTSIERFPNLEDFAIKGNTLWSNETVLGATRSVMTNFALGGPDCFILRLDMQQETRDSLMADLSNEEHGIHATIIVVNNTLYECQIGDLTVYI